MQHESAKRGLDSICTDDTMEAHEWAVSSRLFRSKHAPSDKDRTTLKLAVSVALKGGALSRSQFSADWQPYCDDPVGLDMTTDPKNEGRTINVQMRVPCRKCARCLQFRQMLWREKAMIEIERHHRTWFTTLTFDPPHLAGILAEARKKAGVADTASIDRAAYAHVQRYLKRLRKAAVQIGRASCRGRV